MNRTFKVVNFSPSTTRKDGLSRVAGEIQNLIQSHVNQGWEYEGIETITFWVAGTNGCFGFGGTPGSTQSIQMMIFSQSVNTPS